MTVNRKRLEIEQRLLSLRITAASAEVDVISAELKVKKEEIIEMEEQVRLNNEYLTKGAKAARLAMSTA